MTKFKKFNNIIQYTFILRIIMLLIYFRVQTEIKQIEKLIGDINYK